MKTKILILLTVVLSACQKEIQLNLNSKESKLVIEADLSGTKTMNTVRITKTGEINQPNEFQNISGAMVVLTDNEGYQEVLAEESAGIYHTSNFKGVVGRRYFLTVRYNDKTYEAQSTIQQPVKLDTAFAVKTEYLGMELSGFMPVFTDQAGERNYYRFIQFKNGKRFHGSILIDDQFTDGQPNMQPISTMGLELKKGDTLVVEMQCIDKTNYTYFNSKNQTANLQSAAPANPESNLSNGALGFFNVYMGQEKRMVVQ